VSERLLIYWVRAFGQLGAVAVTGHNQPLRFLPESGRSPAIAGHEPKDSR
jgi:hypothetical protein